MSSVPKEPPDRSLGTLTSRTHRPLTAARGPSKSSLVWVGSLAWALNPYMTGPEKLELQGSGATELLKAFVTRNPYTVKTSSIKEVDPVVRYHTVKKTELGPMLLERANASGPLGSLLEPELNRCRALGQCILAGHSLTVKRSYEVGVHAETARLTSRTLQLAEHQKSITPTHKP